MGRLIGVHAWLWVSPLTDADLAVLAPKVRAWGFDAMELPILAQTDWEPARAADVLAANELGAVVSAGLQPGHDLITDDRDTLEHTWSYVESCVRAAHRIGAKVVAGPLYAPVGRRWLMDPGQRRTTVARLARNLRPVADFAAAHGVRLALEPLNRYDTSVVNTVDQALEIVSMVDSPGIGVSLDTFHLNIEERDPAAAIRSAGSHLAHMQVCANDRGAPGADHLDWLSLLAAIDGAGYQGPLCIESFTAPSLATTMSVWRPLADTPDVLATTALSFLRSLGAARN